MVVRKIKEKCKDAARMRREKERAEFVELSKLLPLPSSITSQLDKASVIRLTSCYLKMRSAFPRGLGHNWGATTCNQHPYSSAARYSATSQANSCGSTVRELGSLLLQTLDGFVFALHKDGKIMYISETASVLLGLPQIDLAGSSIFDYVLTSDHNDILNALNLTDTELNQIDPRQKQTRELELPRAFCMRMKCILPKRNAGLVSGGHKAIHCNGYLKLKHTLPDPGTTNSTGGFDGEWESCALVAVGHSLLPTASTEVKLNSSSFMFRANLDFTLYFVEPSFSQMLGFEQTEMIGQSLYKFVHTSDLNALESSHKSLLDKGEVVTRYCRLIKRTGGCLWVQSYATLVNNPRNMPKPQHIVSVCQVLANDSFEHGPFILNEPSGQQVISHSDTQENTGDGPILDESGYQTKLQQLTKEFSITNRSKKLRTRCNREYQPVLAEGNTSNIKYVETYSSVPKENHSYLTIGSTRRISDDTSSVASSVASTHLSFSSMGSVTTETRSDSTEASMINHVKPQEFYSRQPIVSFDQNLKDQRGNSLESITSSCLDIYNHHPIQFKEEASSHCNHNWPNGLSPTSGNHLHDNYNHVISSNSEYCSCSSSSECSNQAGNYSRSNQPASCSADQLIHPYRSSIFYQYNEIPTSIEITEQPSSHQNSYTYCVENPHLVQYHQQIPLYNGYSS